MTAMVRVSAEDLRVVLAQRVMHSHARPGIWDWDNGAKANTACEECAARQRLAAALAGGSEIR